MSAAASPSVVRFRYSIFTYLSVCTTVAASAIMVHAWLWPPIPASPVALLAGSAIVGAIWFGAGLFLSSPLALVIGDETIRATYLWGASRTWPLSTLRLQKVPSLASRLTSADDVLTTEGHRAFRVWPGLVGPFDFSEAIRTPHTTQARPNPCPARPPQTRERTRPRASPQPSRSHIAA